MPDVLAQQESPNLILVSACLLGSACCYAGRSHPVVGLCDLATEGLLLPVCTEVAGGLTTPCPPTEIEGASDGLDGHAVREGRARVARADGADVTAQFARGAEAALALAQRLGIRSAVLKANSPSCGTGRIASGSFDGRLVAGDGVTAALLKRAGIQVVSEMDLPGGKR